MIIPVVFAINDAYSPMLGVVIHSLARWANDLDEYELYVLNEGIGEGHKQKLLSLSQKQVSIHFVDITDVFKEYKIGTVGHLSKETTYRLLIPAIFQQYDKVLYLDSDILICRDVAELYKENIDGYAMAASRARLFQWSHDYISGVLQISERDYFNPGILLMNLPLFRKYRFGEIGLKMLEERNYMTQDQDVLNILSQNHEGGFPVKILDGRWNFEWGHLTENGDEAYIDEARKGSLEQVNDPWIIHYTTRKKPWCYPELMLADRFWEEARQCVFYEELVLMSSAQRFRKDWIEPSALFERFVFPWEMFRPGEKIILYGAGIVGRTLYTQLLNTEYCHVIAVCDKRDKAVENMAVSVITPEELDRFRGFPILIAIEDRNTADEIRTGLINAGIDEQSIRWADYRRRRK